MPKVRKGETEDSYVKRCVQDDYMVSKYPDLSQRLAVCYSIYNKGGDKKTKEDK